MNELAYHNGKPEPETVLKHILHTERYEATKHPFLLSFAPSLPPNLPSLVPAHSLFSFSPLGLSPSANNHSPYLARAYFVCEAVKRFTCYVSWLFITVTTFCKDQFKGG